MTDIRAPGIALLDVDYRKDAAVAACVLADGWEAPGPRSTYTARVEGVAPYVPGRFYERELPCLEAVLALLPETRDLRPDILVVDGYAWLGEGRPGLGARLFQALGGTIPVVGVAKTAFASAPSVEVRRGESARPLYVTAAGMAADAAARDVARMHGEHRVPTLLACVDRIARTSMPSAVSRPIRLPRGPSTQNW